MFNSGDIREIAMQIERNGEQSYRRASARVDAPEVAALLARMADEEARHAHWFAQLPAGAAAGPEDAAAQDLGRRLLRDMVRDQTFSLEEEALVSVGDLHEMLRLCLGFEEDTIAFYGFVYTLLEDPEVKVRMESIIEEERRHALELGRLLGST